MESSVLIMSVKLDLVEAIDAHAYFGGARNSTDEGECEVVFHVEIFF